MCELMRKYVNKIKPIIYQYAIYNLIGPLLVSDSITILSSHIFNFMF